MGRVALLFLGLLLFGSVLAGPGGPVGDRLLVRYRRADSLFHLDRSTRVTDSLALAGFTAVVNELEKAGARGDTLLTVALLKRGILLDAGGDYARARTAYCGVLGYRPADDSLVFVTQVYVGTVYYNLDRFDSASYFLLRAESLAGRFNDRDNSVRLYNTLGALYCDNGNFRQGRNYFDHALELVRGGKTYDTAAAVSLQINIATASFRVGQYEDALAIYRQLLGYRPLRDYVYENMGRAYAGMEDYPSALAWFRRVSLREIPRVLNEMANAELRLNRPDSCRWYLSRLRELGPSAGSGKIGPLDLGLNAFYGSEELSRRGDVGGALKEVQRAIDLFAGNFNKRDAYGNPVGFSGAFAYYRLFDALVRKAELHNGEKNLEASYATYSAALSLLRYIERSYATDEAKLFLKKNSGIVYAEALAVCLELDRRHPGGDYLEQAFLIGERSKASVITANLEEKAFMGAPEAKGLLGQVDNYKYRIARLNVRSEGVTDSSELAAITREKEGDEIELLRLQKALEQDGEYYRVKYGDASPGIRDLQGELGRNQALVSLYAAGGVLHVFVVTRDGLRHVAVDSLARLERDVEAWLEKLKATGSGGRFNGGAVGQRLFAALVKPIQEAAGGRTEWVIVPDGVFALLPFESLYADATGNQWLVETTTISYRFSSRLLSGEPSSGKSVGSGVLSFAPFGDRGADVFQRLPASKEEIAGLPGLQWLDGQATKERFLATVNQYPIVHLATHAVSSMDNAAGSFIAFYPGKGRTIDNRLYLEELYGLNLQPTRLVIISACETGQGEVVPQEGVISLARAFAYAGCGSTINSLWKADDQATSLILKRFYAHLREGETKARALQLAKLDYLKSDAIDKSPSFWAHLVLTGDSGALYSRRGWVLWVVIGLAVMGAGGIVLFLKRRRV
ncbi:MAG TPA: CHAT domain-containing tetratricopeptide repeat protein [Puia sp.]|uniref:CHAT domain-containing protein n=1 Tax=Puia sp. TaxID=2045100 RepID=UPI002C0D74D7|nr:CHAT domain-containing tetratricopeptide repeat protein [Puia sp.]HVU94774.1 CHAT domain-containing tetratricopeptide repeat protein [Puia sp.]